MPLTTQQAYRHLMANVPAGMLVLGSGRESSPDGPVMLEVSYRPQSVPAGIDYAQLVAGIVPGRRGQALLRADAEVVWYPARSAQEHLDAARFAQVTVSARVYSPRPHTIRRVVRTPADIAHLAALLNGLPANPALATSCPVELVTYRVAFGGTRAVPAVVAITGSCPVDSVTVTGRAQPALQDSHGTLAAAARQLLHHKPQP